jgi:hypothetical protein
LDDADREALLAMGEDLPKIWNAATTTAADRKQILRFLVRGNPESTPAPRK